MPAGRDERTRAVAVVLDHAEHRHGQSEAVEHRLRNARVLRAAVDEQQIRQRAKARVAVEIVLKAARERLMHGAVVVLSVRRADAKLPVVGLARPPVLKHGHAGDDAAVAEVGDVKRLNALGRRIKLERALQPFERFEAALRLGRCDEDLLARVFVRHLRQAALVAALRHGERDLVPRRLGEQLLERILPLERARQQHLPRIRAAALVILLHERGKCLTVGLHRLFKEGFVLVREVAVGKVQHGEAALCPARKADGVRVGVSRGDDALVVFQPLDGAKPVAQRRRIFKPQRLGRGLHLLGQLGSQLRRAPVEDHLRLADGLQILRTCDVLQAIACAGAHVVIQARAGTPDIARETARARRQAQRFADGIDDLRRHAPPAIRTEVFRAVLFRAVDERKRRVRLRHIQTHKGIALIVLEQDVVFWLVQLDERVFEHERLEFGLHDDDIEIRNVRDHGRHLRQVLAAKIARDAVFECFCLADVDDLTVLVEHDVHARQQWEHIGLFAQLFGSEFFHSVLLLCRKICGQENRGVL